MSSGKSKERSIAVMVFICIFCVVVALLINNSHHKSQQVNTNNTDIVKNLSVKDIDLSRIDFLQDKYRKEQGLTPFVLSENQIFSSSLMNGAYSICNDMVQKNYYSYTSPDGQTLNNMLLKFTNNAFNKSTTVNVSIIEGYDSADDVFNALVSNSGDLNNITNPSFTSDGIGICKSDNFLSKGPALIVVLTYGYTN